MSLPQELQRPPTLLQKSATGSSPRLTKTPGNTTHAHTPLPASPPCAQFCCSTPPPTHCLPQEGRHQKQRQVGKPNASTEAPQTDAPREKRLPRVPAEHLPEKQQ